MRNIKESELIAAMEAELKNWYNIKSHHDVKEILHAALKGLPEQKNQSLDKLKEKYALKIFGMATPYENIKPILEDFYTEYDNLKRLPEEAKTVDSMVSKFQKQGIFFRFENDENGFYLSIINRQVYPRVWADNFADGGIEIIAESAENILNRTAAISEKDWSERFFGETIKEVIENASEWINKQSK